MPESVKITMKSDMNGMESHSVPETLSRFPDRHWIFQQDNALSHEVWFTRAPTEDHDIDVHGWCKKKKKPDPCTQDFGFEASLGCFTAEQHVHVRDFLRCLEGGDP